MAGVDGDWYLNTATGDIFHKESGSWVLKGNLKGAMGDTGPQGDTGDTGPAGAAGSQWLSGASDPT